MTLSKMEANYNFIQSSINIYTKRGRYIYILIMKQSEVPLQNMSDVGVTCIVLYNLCILNNKGIEYE